jgi:hypothetical protein
MDRQRTPRAWSRAWLPMSAAALLAACQASPPLAFFDRPAEVATPGWRVVERIGEARYLAPSMAGWEEIVAGSMVPAGSQIVTGIGGRLIVHHAANQLSAGTNSRFILPGWEQHESVRQTAGWLRYRVATAPSAPFGIETPFLDLVVDDAVLDVTVGDSETEVAVVSGRVRVKTLDDRRQIDLHAGYTGYASLQGDPLAVRRGPGQRLEAVPPIVVPALHPDRAPSARMASEPAGPATPTAATAAPTIVGLPALAVARRDATAAPAADPAIPPSEPGSAGAAEAVVPLPPALEAPADAEHVEAAQAEEIRRRFDGLTEGLLDGLPPALPEPQRDGR